MEFKIGESFTVSFTIKGKTSLSSASFTGKTLTIDKEKKFLVDLASGKKFIFSQANLDSFAPLNNPDLMDTEKSITMG